MWQSRFLQGKLPLDGGLSEYWGMSSCHYSLPDDHLGIIQLDAELRGKLL